jgi:hypothetical protein
MAMANMAGGKPAKKYTAPKGAAPRKKTAKKTVVSQAVIDKIKSDGMTAALKKAGAGGVGAAYMEGVKRMYGAKRVAAAVGKNAALTSSKNATKANVANEKARVAAKFK